MEVLTIDLKQCNLSKVLSHDRLERRERMDRLEQRNKIHGAVPNMVGSRNVLMMIMLMSLIGHTKLELRCDFLSIW